MKVAILGAGAMGSALAIPLVDKGHEVRLWFTKFDMPIYEEVSKGRPHPRIKVVLPVAIKLFKPDELSDALKDVDVAIIAVSSRGVQPISELVKETIGVPEFPLIVVSKGIEVLLGRAMTMTEIVREYSGSDKVVYVGGPSLAAELANKRLTYVVYASKYISVAEDIAREFSTDYYRIDVTDDVIGVEVSAALKNIYAIAYGAIEGYLEANNMVNNNLKAGYLAKALNEMAFIVSSCGGRKETVFGLGGLGDLYVTSLGGRNSMFGRLLGKGLSVKEAFEEMQRRGVGVVEGYKNAETIEVFLRQKNVPRDKTPIFNAVYSILYEGSSIDTLFKAIR